MVATKQGMADQTDSNVARDGAAKSPQTSFPTKDGMKDMNAMSGIGPGGTGPDASSPNPLDPEPRGKDVKAVTEASWGQVTGDGDSFSPALGTAVLNQSVVSGGRIPASTTEQSASGANPSQP